MEARINRTPKEATSSRSFTSSGEGAVPARIGRVRSVDAVVSQAPKADRPAVRSLPKAEAAAPTPKKEAAPKADEAVVVAMTDAQPAEPTVADTDDATQTDKKAISRKGIKVKAATVAAGAAISLAACGSDPSPAEGGPDPDLTTYTATCYKPYTTLGNTRWQEVQADQNPRSGDEATALEEAVRERNDDADAWYQPFEQQSGKRNEMPITWPCKPGTSIYEVKPGTNGQYANPEAVREQDPTAMRYMDRRHGN